MSLTIRRAGAADVALVAEFNRLLALESEGKTLDTALLTAGVAAGLADPNKSVYFVAEDDGKAVGQIMYTTEWSDWRNGWFWWIQSVYVCPEARRRGVFRALFEHVYQTARTDGNVIGLRLYVEGANHVAQETYRRMGMEAAGYLVFERYPL
ncbi:MAG TPA: GNAT family N-acetyltransferase [Gemmataceae bacterium]|jgi:GNAT superfamily N-acetyltransferase